MGYLKRKEYESLSDTEKVRYDSLGRDETRGFINLGRLEFIKRNAAAKMQAEFEEIRVIKIKRKHFVEDNLK